jgi:hypothetical protein
MALDQIYIAPCVMQGTGLAISRRIAALGHAGPVTAAGQGGRCSFSP